MKYLIIGLGNIGEEYWNICYNIGFIVLDVFVKVFNFVFIDGCYGVIVIFLFKGC